MAYSKSSNNANKAEGWKAIPELEGFTIIGSRDRFSVSFQPCEGLRVQINGCRIVDGKNGPFISYPSWKDKDGNYHNYCYFEFAPEDAEAVIKALD